MAKETLQQKVDRLNGYHVNEHDWHFDRLFSPLKAEIEQMGKRLVCRDGLYVIEANTAKDVSIGRLTSIAPFNWQEGK